MTSTRSTAFLMTAGLILTLGPAGAARATPPSPPTSQEDTPATQGVDHPTAVGVWIWVDPLTGALTSVRPEGVRPPLDPDKRFHQDPETLVPFALQDGGRGVRVGGHFVSTFRVEVDADGSLRAVCREEHDHSADVVAPAVEEAPKS